MTNPKQTAASSHAFAMSNVLFYSDHPTWYLREGNSFVVNGTAFLSSGINSSTNDPANPAAQKISESIDNVTLERIYRSSSTSLVLFIKTKC